MFEAVHSDVIPPAAAAANVEVGGGGAVDAAPAELDVAASAVLTEGEIKEAIILGYESDNR